MLSCSCNKNVGKQYHFDIATRVFLTTTKTKKEGVPRKSNVYDHGIVKYNT